MVTVGADMVDPVICFEYFDGLQLKVHSCINGLLMEIILMFKYCLVDLRIKTLVLKKVYLFCLCFLLFVQRFPIDRIKMGAGFHTKILNVIVDLKSSECSHLGVSKKRGTPKSSILIGFSIINHPFWGTSIFGLTPISFVSAVLFFNPCRRF